MDAHWDTPPATQANMELFYAHLEETLSQIGFLNPAAPRQLMPRLRRLYSRLRLDEMELNILRGMLTETQKRIDPVDWSARPRRGRGWRPHPMRRRRRTLRGPRLPGVGCGCQWSSWAPDARAPVCIAGKES